MENLSMGDQQIKGIKESLIYIIRYRLNTYIGKTGATTADLIARLVWILIAFVLGLILYIFANVFFITVLAPIMGSLISASMTILGLHILFMTLLILFKTSIENAIRNGLAEKVLEIQKQTNEQLDLLIPDIKLERQVYSSSKVKPFVLLNHSNLKNEKLAKEKQEKLTEQVIFVKNNIKSVGFSIATDRIEKKMPMGGVFSTLLHFFEPKPQLGQTKPSDKQKGGRRLMEGFNKRMASPKNKDRVRRLRPYLPYIGLAWQISRPFISSLLIKKGQKTLLNLFTKKKKR